MENNRQARCVGQCCGLCCTKIENFGVTKGSMRILENVNMHIHCGELTAVIGPNGAGKSTLLKALLGEVQHTGELKYLDSKGTRSGQPVIGYVPQQLSFDTGTPTSVLDLFTACLSGKPAWLFKPAGVKRRAIEGLARVKAEHLIDRRLGALSGGELQRVLLALALEPVPNLLLLDEPVSGMDQGGLELFYKTVSEVRKNYDLSIILVSHDLEFVAKYADRVILLNRTVIASGTPQVVFNSESAREAFGISCFFQSLDSTSNDGTSNNSKSNDSKSNDRKSYDSTSNYSRSNDSTLNDRKINDGKTNISKLNDNRSNYGKLNDSKLNDSKATDSKSYNSTSNYGKPNDGTLKNGGKE